ncbi:SIS domain-containing protein [Kitasatospora sp. NPDC057015]|uniref:SIS domain-containing protein n=1 Tax=Kitasatospora sp. NPDC057015 TaxID=3346001 RepID=UPI0036286C65
MFHVEAETASQPESWARAAAMAPGHTGNLPAPGERVAVIGCGTSLYMAQAYAGLREGSGRGETDAYAASEFPTHRAYDTVIALTRSGTTTEVLDLLGVLRGTTRTIAITADPRTPIITVADCTIVLEFADEQSVVQTRFATTALTLLRANLGLHTPQVEADARAALADPLPEELLTATQFTFLGANWTTGLANEAALKMREAARAWTESYPAMEYRHGPISISAPGTVTWMLGTASQGLAEQVRSTGALWIEGSLDPLAELVRVHRLTAALAKARGINPDQPRNLTRSVVLEDA